jgi:hypothetical protein
VITTADLRGAYQPRRVLDRLEKIGDCRRIRPLPFWAVPSLADRIEQESAAGLAEEQPPTVPALKPIGVAAVEVRRRLALRGFVCARELAPLPNVPRAMGFMVGRGECVQIGALPIWALPTIAVRIQAAIAEYQRTHGEEAQA